MPSLSALSLDELRVLKAQYEKTKQDADAELRVQQKRRYKAAIAAMTVEMEIKKRKANEED